MALRRPVCKENVFANLGAFGSLRNLSDDSKPTPLDAVRLGLNQMLQFDQSEFKRNKPTCQWPLNGLELLGVNG